MKIPPNIFFACKHFGTGVLIATAFVHVRRTSVNHMAPADQKDSSYPQLSLSSATHACRMF